jgi:hypothetical protein
MYCEIYLRRGTIYLPTMGRMDKGFYRGVEPVTAVSVANIDALHKALAAMIARGNPKVPMLLRREWPPPVLLKYAGVKNWSSFERGMQFWALEEKDGHFQIAGNSKQPDGMWKDDPKQTMIFPPGSTVDDVTARMIAILQDAARG